MLGVQRLATLPDREHRLERALSAGVRWLDTADLYGSAPGEAEAWLAPHVGRVSIATKGGLVWVSGRPVPDGRAAWLEAAAERSRDRLRAEAIDLYQWHAPDPKVPVHRSLRALRRILDRGLARAVGLCNCSVDTLRRAVDELPVATVQVEVGPTRPGAVRSGVVEEAQARGIPVWGYRPFGGPSGARRALSDRRFARVAARLGVRPAQVVLAWLRGLGIEPLAGPTDPEHVEDLAAARSLVLGPDDVAELDEAFEIGLLRVPRARRAPDPGARPEVVLLMGRPGAGKSTAVSRWPDHLRLNRDERGGTLEGLLRPLDQALAAGRSVVLDNTYPARAQRNRVIEAAWRRGAPVRCVWLDTAEDDAEINVVLRIWGLLGRLPEPHEILGDVVGQIPPRALHRFREELEPPDAGEGFADVERVGFVRRWPAGEARALLFDPRSLDDAEHRAILAEGAAAGRLLAAIGWEPGVDRAVAEARVVSRAAAHGLDVWAATCPHPPGPPRCWCRKPLPGLAVRALLELRADPTRSALLPIGPADRSIARKLGFELISPTSSPSSP